MKSYIVKDRKPVIEKVKSKYLSFPQLAKINENRIMMIYREASSNPDIVCHGKDDGDIKYMFFESGRWGRPKLLYEHKGEYEQMGCDPTALNNGMILIHSREYKSGGFHKNYIAGYDTKKNIFTEKKFLEYGEFIEGKMALFSKIIELDDGRLLLGAYGGDKEAKITWTTATGKKMSGSSAGCLVSNDKGGSWEFYSWIARADSRLNFFEPVMIKLEGSILYCLLRTMGDFYYTRSADNGKTWDKPKKAYFGNAATGLKLSTGEMMMLYRGNLKKDGDAYRRKLYVCRVSGDGGKTWSDEVEIDNNSAYQPGSFGMGDGIELKDGSIKVVYYTSDIDQAPWIEECLLVPK